MVNLLLNILHTRTGGQNLNDFQWESKEMEHKPKKKEWLRERRNEKNKIKRWMKGKKEMELEKNEYFETKKNRKSW